MVNVYVFANGLLIANERCEKHTVNAVVASACRKCTVDAEDSISIQVQIV